MLHASCSKMPLCWLSSVHPFLLECFCSRALFGFYSSAPSLLATPDTSSVLSVTFPSKTPMGRISPYHHFQNQTPGTSQGLVSSRHVLVTYSVSLENSEVFGGAQYISPTGLAEVVVIESYVRQAELHALSPAQEFLREQHVTPPLYVSCHSVPVSFSKEHRTGICTKEGIESVRPVRIAIPIAPILLQLLHNCLLPSLIFLIKFKSGPKDSKHLEEKKMFKTQH